VDYHSPLIYLERFALNKFRATNKKRRLSNFIWLNFRWCLHLCGARKNSENGFLRFEQSIIHKEYLEHIFDKFSYLGRKNVSIKVADRKLFNTSSVYFTSRQLTAITELHTLFYHDGRKIVPFNIGSLLTEKSLASWTMDDGDNHTSGYILNTSGFSLNDVKLLQAKKIYPNEIFNA